MLKFIDKMCIPFDWFPPVQITDIFEFDIEPESIEALNKVDFRFNAFSVNLSNAKFLSDSKYLFSKDKLDFWQMLILDYDDQSSKYSPKTINNIIGYLIDMFSKTTLINYCGSRITMEKFFTSIMHIKFKGTTKEIEFSYDKPRIIDNSLELEFEDDFHNDGQVEYDYTDITMI